jgi:hypothetical protein
MKKNIFFFLYLIVFCFVTEAGTYRPAQILIGTTNAVREQFTLTTTDAAWAMGCLDNDVLNNLIIYPSTGVTGTNYADLLYKVRTNLQSIAMDSANRLVKKYGIETVLKAQFYSTLWVDGKTSFWPQSKTWSFTTNEAGNITLPEDALPIQITAFDDWRTYAPYQLDGVKYVGFSSTAPGSEMLLTTNGSTCYIYAERYGDGWIYIPHGYTCFEDVTSGYQITIFYKEDKSDYDVYDAHTGFKIYSSLTPIQAPTPKLSILPSKDGTVKLTVLGASSSLVCVEYSTDNIKWTPLCDTNNEPKTTTLSNGTAVFTDTMTTSSMKFYRIKVLSINQ